MVRILKVLVIIALAAVLVIGLTTTACCDGVDGNGDGPNGNVPNGNEPNGSVPGEPDLSGLGLIIDCDEYTGQGLQSGDPAPDFRFQDAVGQTFSLSDFRGRLVLLNFWTTWCGFCIVELPYLEQIYEEWPSDELLLLAVDIGESPGTVNDYIEDNEIFLPVVLDREREVTAQYRVNSIPRTLFIDKEGIIQVVMFGAFNNPEEIEDILNQLASQ